MKIAMYLVCALLFSGCVSLQQTRQAGIKKVDNLNAFDGVYQNVYGGNDTSEFSSLWNQLKLSNDLDSLDFKQAKIELTAIGKNKIKAVWLQENIPKAELILSGKLKNNYFVSKSKRTLIPIPLIYGEFKNNQFQLALGENNNLQIDRLQNQWGWVFLFFANNDSSKSFEYSVIKIGSK